jgi:tRNA A-37 threonylcarbamoyl transferase component Bud32
MNCPKCQAEILDDSRFCSKCGTPIHPGDKAFLSQTHTILRPIDELVPGAVLAGKYKIIAVAGRGGMGIVYKAEDIKLKRTVALKFLPPELTQDKESKERFVLEAQSAAALSHPNICTIHEINEEEEKSFIAMEYFEGKTLREEIEKGPLGVERTLEIARQVAAGLEEAHKKGIIHRDIKSSNIMVSDKGQAKILDFGLAKVKGGTLLTREGTTLGTVAYMSPEQAQGEEVDRRTDLWSLGVVLYEMLSGVLPFEGEREASVLYSVVHEEPRALKEIKRDLPLELQQIVNRALKKKPESRHATAAEIINDLTKYEDTLRAEELGAFNLRTFLRRIRRPQIAIPAICAVLLLAMAAVWFFNRQAKIRWAREEILPEVERLVEENFRDFTDAYRLAVEAEKIIPHDPRLLELISESSVNLNITTEPPGADIYVKEYDAPEAEWEYVGVSPLEQARLPIGIVRWKIEKEGCEPVLAASLTMMTTYKPNNVIIGSDLMRVLDKEGSLPEGMVRVIGAETPLGKLGDFFIDKYEVTNKQYKEFVDAGGYKNKQLWKHEFLDEGKVLSWEEAMAEFVDQTGRPGPSTWQAGDYPEGQDDLPVSGLSWYEAAAYAEFLGKTLPTGTHWGIARGEATPLIRIFQFGGDAVFVPFSNFQEQGPVPVGSLPGITAYGAYDMAGNVREWCWNETQNGRLIRGGAWNDPVYMFGALSQTLAFDRSPYNGFRCAKYPDPEEIPGSIFQKVELGEAVDFSNEKPVPDSIFQIYKEQFLYDKTDVNAAVESRDESSKDWILETITFDAAYGEERIIACLFLPKNTAPPYQTIVYFPGGQALFRRSSKDIVGDLELSAFISFLMKNGRAVLYPVYKGTMERHFERPQPWVNTHRQAEYRVQLVKDYKRCIDYLETRQDIDSEKLAFYGLSWGADWPASVIPAVEDRLKTSIVLAGGLSNVGLPEVKPINYVTRVKIPTLMIGGRYDSYYNYEKSIKPMYDLLGTPDEHKELKLYETDHIPPKNEFIKEILDWLDRYLGPVNR